MLITSALRGCCVAGVCLISLALGCGSDDEQSQPAPEAPALDIVALENDACGLMGQFAYDKAVKKIQQLVSAEQITQQQRSKFTVDLAIALLNRRQESDL